MNKQIIIVCDDKGNPTNQFVPKEAGHTGGGRHHLAITVLLINSRTEVLLQKRKHIRFDGLWDLTGATDLYHVEGGNETFEQATMRCLKREYGIDHVKDLKNLGGFNYFAPYRTAQGEFCENEFCAMMTGEYNGEINMDPQVGYEYKWVDKQDFLNDIDLNPRNYTPWAIEGVKVLKQTGFLT